MRSLVRRIHDHNRATLEAQWTPEQALEWAKTQYPGWTRRRFRLEGGRGGCSRLTTRAAAERLQARCGGVVVEVIPTQKEWEREQSSPASDAASSGSTSPEQAGADG